MQKFLRTLMLLALMLPFASQAQLTLPISMDFEDAAAFNQWTRVNCHSSTTRSTTANAIHEGSAGFAFHWSTTSSNPRQHLISPEFTPAMGSEMLSFWYQNASTTYVEEFSVGFSSTTNDTAAFTWLPAVSVPFVSWTEYTASVPAGTKYVCIRSNAYDKYYLYIDDIYIGEAPTCFKVTNLAIDASQTTTSSLTLTWTDTINTGATYSIYNMADSSVVAENINGTTYTVDNLAANTAYAFGVMTDCGGGDVTGFATVSGRTACGAISLPWTCGFEADEIVNTTQATALPWCSQRYVTPGATSGTNYPYSYSGYSHSGSRSLYYYGSTSASYPAMMAWILPELDVATYPMNANRVVFWAKMSSTSYSKYVYVYTVTDPTDITTATIVDSVQVTGTTHTKYSVPLTSAPATDAYLVLAVMKGNGSLYIDDVTLEEMPSCLEVPTATVDTATASSITLRWTENSGNASATYSVYILTPTDNTLVESNITGTTYTVENLDANTPYVFAVQANCPAGDAPYTLVNGRTACAAFAVPYTWDFEDMNTGAAPICWTKLTGGSANVLSGSGDAYYHSATKYVQFQGIAGNNILVLPETEDEINTLQVRFWTRPESTSNSNCGTFSVGYMTDPTDATTFVAVVTYTYSDFTAYEEKSVTFGSAPTGARMAMRHDALTTGWYWRVDDVTIEEAPACLPVTVVLDSLMGTTAYVSWANTGASNYEVEVRQNDVAVTTASVLIEYDTTAVISDLEIDNDYQVVVRADCSGDYSPWSSPVNVHIGYCLPNPTSVDGSGITGVAFGGMTNTTNHPTSSPYYMNNSTMTGSVPAGTTASVDITFATGYTYGTIIWVDWNNSMSFDTNEVVYRGTSLNTNPTTLTAEFDIPATMEEGNYRMRIAAADSYFDSYVSNPANNPNPCFSGTYSCAEDYTLTVTEAPSCTHVTGLTASDITAESVVLRWTGTASAYNVYEINGTDATLVQTVYEDTILIENLTAMTNYTYGVASVCGSEESDTVYVSITTSCATVAMPFTQNFNNLTAGIPMCWDNEEGTTTTADYRWNYYATGHDGAGLRFNCYYNSNGNTNVLATPAITIDEAAQLSFWYKNPAGGDFTVMVGIAGSDTRTTLATGLTGASDWTLATYVLPDSLIDENVVVYFKGTSNYGNGDAYIYLDDVTIEAVPNCLPVTGLTATDITATGATLTWTGEADSYNVYTIAGDDITLVANVTSNSLEIENLTAMTNYTYGVRSVCGSDEGSMVVVEFATACSAIAIPFTENFETTSPTFQCWTVDGVSSTGLSNDAFLFYYSYNPPQYLVSPELSGVTDGLTVSFLYKAYSEYYPESFQLGYSTTTNAYADFTWLAEVNNITSLTYTEYSQILPGAVKYVAVKYTANNQYGLYIDSMVFAEPPACMPVTDLTVDSVTATSVFLSWNGTAAAYNIYSATGNVVATGVTTTNYEVTGLTASTNYTFGVASVCGSDQSDVVTVPARTDCTGGSCTIKIYAEDEYGDGWADEYGAAYSNITISQNGATVATYSMQSQNLSNTTIYDTFTVNVCSGVPVTFTWNSNSEYDSEASFKILDGNDTVLISVSDASMLTDGAAFLTVNDACGSNTPIQILDSMKVTVAVNNATMGTTVPAPGVHYFYEGEVASVVAQPAAGYHLVGWTVLTTVDYGSYGGITTIIDTTLNIAEPNVFTLFDFDTVQAGYHVFEWTVTANFAAGEPELDTVTLIVNVPDPTRGTTTPAPGTHYFTTGQTLSLTAQPAAGYMLADWMYTVVNPTGDTVVDAEYADTNVTEFFDIFEDFPAVGPMLDGFIINVTPIFQGVIPTTHTVTVTSMNPQMGTVNPEGDSVVNDGSSFTATANANEGYHFVNWVDAGSNVITDNPYTFVVNSNVTLRAVFAADSVAPTTYTVTVNVNDSTMGHVTGVPTAPVTANTVISLTAVPEAGYHFVSWSNGANTATITVTVTSDTVLTATFAANPADTYTLTVAYDATMGSVEGIPEAPVAAGTVVTLTAIPAEGYHFVEWSTGETTATISVTVNSNMTLTATFAANAVDKYLVSVLWDATMGNVTGVPTDSVPAGSPVTLMANPLEGYQFVAWMIGEDTVGHNAVYTIDSVSANVTLVALFAVKTGIEDVEMSNVKIYSAESVIYVMGAEGQNVYLYDLNGRVINAAPKAGERVEFRMNNTGVYLVKVGTAAAKRVVVTR